ncbi:unnamed protein product, partial [Brassica oleracea var. botrytis]
KVFFFRICSGTTRAKADHDWISTLRLTFVTISSQSLPCFYDIYIRYVYMQDVSMLERWACTCTVRLGNYEM